MKRTGTEVFLGLWTWSKSFREFAFYPLMINHRWDISTVVMIFLFTDSPERVFSKPSVSWFLSFSLGTEASSCIPWADAVLPRGLGFTATPVPCQYLHSDLLPFFSFPVFFFFFLKTGTWCFLSLHICKLKHLYNFWKLYSSATCSNLIMQPFLQLAAPVSLNKRFRLVPCLLLTV